MSLRHLCILISAYLERKGAVTWWLDIHLLMGKRFISAYCIWNVNNTSRKARHRFKNIFLLVIMINLNIWGGFTTTSSAKLISIILPNSPRIAASPNGPHTSEGIIKSSSLFSHCLKCLSLHSWKPHTDSVKRALYTGGDSVVKLPEGEWRPTSVVRCPLFSCAPSCSSVICFHSMWCVEPRRRTLCSWHWNRLMWWDACAHPRILNW